MILINTQNRRSVEEKLLATKFKYWLPYFFLWTFSYLLYPCWLVPGSPLRKYMWLLSFIAYFGLLTILFFKKVDVPDNNIPVKFTLTVFKDRVFVSAAVFFVLLHIYPMSFMPLRTWTDESSHACSGIQILDAVSSGLSRSGMKFGMLQWISRIAAFALIIFAVRYKPWRRFRNLTTGKKLLVVVIPVFILAHLLFFLLKDKPFYTYIYKPPPLSHWLSLGITILTQPAVFWARLPSLLFCILSAALIYEITAFTGCRILAAISAAIFLFLPNVSYYSCNASLGGGTVFLSLLPLFFLMYFLKSKSYSALYWCFFWTAAGFLWKRFLITGEIYFIIILIVYHIFIRRISIKKCLLYWFFSVAAILPFIVMGQFLLNLPLDATRLERCISLCPLFNIWQITLYLSKLPEEITYAGAVSFCAGLFFFFKNRSLFRKFWPVAAGFLCWYILLTMSLKAVPETFSRWQLPLYPFIAVCMGFCFTSIIKKWRKPGIIILAGYLLFMISCSIFLHPAPLHAEYALYRTDTEKSEQLGVYLPYEKMILYMKEHLPPRSKVMADDLPDPREFYSFKHHLNVEWKLVKLQNEILPGIEGLYEKAKSHGASYLFLPEPSYLLHIDRTAAKAIFAGEAVQFRRVKIFTGRNGRVGLFEIKGLRKP